MNIANSDFWITSWFRHDLVSVWFMLRPNRLMLILYPDIFMFMHVYLVNNSFIDLFVGCRLVVGYYSF